MDSSSGGSFNIHANSSGHVPPPRRVTSFADLFSSDHKQEDQQKSSSSSSSTSSSGGSMNFELVNNQDENIKLIPKQIPSFPAAAASWLPQSPPLSPSFSPSHFLDDHLPVLYSPSYVPPSPTMETFAGLFWTDEEINFADLSSFAPTSAVMTAMDTLGDKEDDGTLINSQAEFSTAEPAPLPPSFSQDIVPTVETTHCFPQHVIPTVESSYCFPQDIPTRKSTHSSAQDITTVETSTVHGNSARVSKWRKSEDGYQWRKYGEKPPRGRHNLGSYYKCNHPQCPSKKKVEYDSSGNIVDVTYKGTHNHPKAPLPQRPYSNPLLTPIMMDFREGSSIITDNLEINEPNAKRRSAPRCRQRRITREPRVVIHTTSDVATLDDGYRWRKYGEKMVKENPNPRSYYKCTSYGCIVTKQIERSADDLKLVITTYEGKHNHDAPETRTRVTYPSGRLPVMNSNSSPTAIMPSLTSSHSDPTMLRTMQNQTPNANQMQQTQSAAEGPNDNSRFYIDDSFLNNLFK